MPTLTDYEPLTVIRKNFRFETYKGVRQDQPVFVKVSTSDKTAHKLLLEATGLINMRELDAKGAYYRVPEVIELGADYIVTSWAEGSPMADDFKEDSPRLTEHLKYLNDLYLFVDSRSNGGVGVTKFTRTDKQDTVDRIQKKLTSAEFNNQIDRQLIDNLANYIREVEPTVETRFTNGDLQPSNLLVAEHGAITVIDCESCSWLWPRHYNLVNFAFNYGWHFPWLRSQLKNMLEEYCRKSELDINNQLDAFNITAAMRSMGILYEFFDLQIQAGTELKLDAGLKEYVETTARQILDHKLFLDL